MNWKDYSECRGKPPCSEVVIRCRAEDADHPWVCRRKRMYEAMGKRVVVTGRPSRTDRRRDDRPGPAA
jgi:hypothetical protein